MSIDPKSLWTKLTRTLKKRDESYTPLLDFTGSGRRHKAMEKFDGPSDILKKRKGGDVTAVFVHAGAGFHSHQNESVHLDACAKAAQASMDFLNTGGSALDAAEAAVRVLEDNEITNAGYGSNLAIDGTVECDATIVDHFGRSGAVGAMGQVSHPIHVARLILDGSTRRLSLRRVPPNLLVGQGAIDYAFENAVPIMHPDFLVSRAAKDRWKRWTRELGQVHGRSSREYGDQPLVTATEPKQGLLSQLGRANLDKCLAPLMNESQPYTPNLSPRGGSPGSFRTPTPSTPKHDRGDGSHEVHNLDVNRASTNSDHVSTALSSSTAEGYPFPPSSLSSATESDTSADDNRDISDLVSDDSEHLEEDMITDTVGAIAIDCYGNIAAASSSGGIGMKHRGRIGPAALVGIGTAVHPMAHGDKSKTSVAVVTSGTGEHMATTGAAQACATRLYLGTKKGPGGRDVSTDDESAIHSFVKDDFMGHPSVKHSMTSAAIGVMAVKKTSDGVWFHFAHNTDSFALCSMTSEDSEPNVVMSRLPGKNSKLTTGARSCGWRPSNDDKKRRKGSA